MKTANKYPSEQWVTVNTDASYDPKTQRGGYGIWIKSNFFTIKRSGEFVKSVDDANKAELWALINALSILEKNDRKFCVLVINCDNATVRSIVNKKQVHKKFRHSKLLLSMLEKYSVSYAKVIRGHSSGRRKRDWVNNWCDRESRKYKKSN